MSWINDRYRFDTIDHSVETYFQDTDCGPETGYAYTFSTLPEFRALIKNQMGDGFSDAQALEIARNAFRNKPNNSSDQYRALGNTVVDFIYEL